MIGEIVMDFREFTAKNVDDAITEACEQLMVTSDRLEYEVVSSGSAGFLGINAKPAIIKARIKEDKPEVKEVAPKTNEVKTETSKVDTKSETKEAPKAEAKKTSAADGDLFVQKANDFLKDVFGAMNMEVNVNTKFIAEE